MDFGVVSGKDFLEFELKDGFFRRWGGLVGAFSG